MPNAATMLPSPISIPRARLRAEIVIVLALSLGASALYSLVNIIDRLTRETALSNQTAEINRALAERPAFDLTYQLLSIIFGLAPVALVIFLTWQVAKPHLQPLGVAPGGLYKSALKRFWIARDAGSGILLALGIGVPGLAFYIGARSFGINAQVVASSLTDYWWTVPVLILAAAKAALLEEFVVVGYLFNRLSSLGWRPWAIIIASALLRGSYHLYQGFGGFIGNVAMGILFGWVYQRWGRLLPLVIAHFALDVASFVGYAWVSSAWPQWF